MNSLEISILSAAVPFLLGLLVREIPSLGGKLIALVSNNPKTAPLAAIIQVGEDALTAAAEAVEANASKGAATAALAGLKAAEACIVAEQAKLVDAAAAEAEALIKAPSLTVVAPGGATDNLPKVK